MEVPFAVLRNTHTDMVKSSLSKNMDVLHYLDLYQRYFNRNKIKCYLSNNHRILLVSVGCFKVQLKQKPHVSKLCQKIRYFRLSITTKVYLPDVPRKSIGI